MSRIAKRMISDEVFGDVASLIGEGVHTGLRKFSNAPSSSVALGAIQRLPNEDWKGIIEMAAAQVIRVLADHKVLRLEQADRRFLHQKDGC